MKESQVLKRCLASSSHYFLLIVRLGPYLIIGKYYTPPIRFSSKQVPERSITRTARENGEYSITVIAHEQCWVDGKTNITLFYCHGILPLLPLLSSCFDAGIFVSLSGSYCAVF